MPSGIHKKAVSGTIVKSVTSNTGFIVLTAYTVEKVVNRAVNKYYMRDVEEAPVTVV